MIRSTSRRSSLSHHSDDTLKDTGRSTAPPLIDQVGIDPAHLNKIFTPAAGRINGGQHHDGELEAVKHLRPRRRHEWALRPGLEPVDHGLKLGRGRGIRATVLDERPAGHRTRGEARWRRNLRTNGRRRSCDRLGYWIDHYPRPPSAPTQMLPLVPSTDLDHPIAGKGHDVSMRHRLQQLLGLSHGGERSQQGELAGAGRS